MTLIRRGIDILLSEGPSAFAKSIVRYIYWNVGLRTAYLNIRHKLEGDTKQIEINGVSAKLLSSSFSEYERFYDLKGEREVLVDLTSKIQEKGVFYDIGANVGLYSCVVANAGCSVYSFEPHPTNADRLRKNLELNKRTLAVFQLALSDKTGTLELASEGEEPGLGEHSLDTGMSGSNFSVTVNRLDDLRESEDIPPPNAVKIDVEGAELDVIRGAMETLSHPDCRLLYCEVHPEKIKNFEGSFKKVRNTLVDYGFEVDAIEEEIGDRIMLRADK